MLPFIQADLHGSLRITVICQTGGTGYRSGMIRCSLFLPVIRPGRICRFRFRVCIVFGVCFRTRVCLFFYAVCSGIRISPFRCRIGKEVV